MQSSSRPRHRAPLLRRQCRDQPRDELGLTCQNLSSRFVGSKPGGTVDFRKGFLAPAPGRPFQLELVAAQLRRIEIAFKREGGHDLASGRNKIPERHELTIDTHPGLLFELPPCCRERILALGIFALRNGPGTEVLFCPEWSAGMDEEKLNDRRTAPIHQNAGTAFAHASSQVIVDGKTR